VVAVLAALVPGLLLGVRVRAERASLLIGDRRDDSADRTPLRADRLGDRIHRDHRHGR